jgi:hypothetical protein
MSDWDDDDWDDGVEVLEDDNDLDNDLNLNELIEELEEVIARYPELTDDEKDSLIATFPTLLG